MTLCLVRQPPRILLGMKKKGLGAGNWNGFGGKVESGESIEEAAIREVKEEAGLTVNTVEKAGVIDFEFKGDPQTLEVHIFHSSDFSGEISESDEMRPEWFEVEKIPYDTMWPDDRFWLPLLLSGKRFRGRFLFGEKNAILESKISEVTTL